MTPIDIMKIIKRVGSANLDTLLKKKVSDKVLDNAIGDASKKLNRTLGALKKTNWYNKKTGQFTLDYLNHIKELTEAEAKTPYQKKAKFTALIDALRDKDTITGKGLDKVRNEWIKENKDLFDSDAFKKEFGKGLKAKQKAFADYNNFRSEWSAKKWEDSKSGSSMVKRFLHAKGLPTAGKGADLKQHYADGESVAAAIWQWHFRGEPEKIDYDEEF